MSDKVAVRVNGPRSELVRCIGTFTFYLAKFHRRLIWWLSGSCDFDIDYPEPKAWARRVHHIAQLQSNPVLWSTLVALLLVALLPPGSTAQSHPAAPSSAAKASIHPDNLECDWSVDPIGIQSKRPSLSWNLEATRPQLRNLHQSAYQVQVSLHRTGPSLESSEVWDSGKVPSTDVVRIQYGGEPLLSHTAYDWRVRVWDQNDRPSAWSAPATWTTGLFEPDDWKAHWIAAASDTSSRQQVTDKPGEGSTSPLPIFRTTFRRDLRVSRAVVYVSGLGQYDLRINGREVTDSVFNPGWTNYQKTIPYNAYDVSSLIRPGKNAIGVMLGNGMYNVPLTPGRYQKFVATFGQPKFILQLHLTFVDGSSATIVSDRTWKVAPGPITFSSIYGGEDYDGRLESGGWDTVGFNDGSWSPVVEVSGPGGRLTAQQIPPIRAMRIFLPVAVSKPKPEVTVYDFGQNFSGWPELTVRGSVGNVVRMVCGELLDSHGLVTQRSSGGPAYFVYKLKGVGTETWHPRFSYYGFRYVQIERAAPSSGKTGGKVKVLGLKAYFLHSSARRVGRFSTSDRLLTRIHELIDLAIESNTQSVLTDCPHRERLGWLEQTHLMGSAIFSNYDVLGLYRKMAQDMSDSQTPQGLVPSIAPEYVAFLGKDIDFRDSPEWGSAMLISPWMAYRYSGDLQILADYYDAMRRYVDYLGSRAQDHILSYGLGDWYDLGPGDPGYSQLTDRSVTATALYFYDLTILGKIAALVHKDGDAQVYGELAQVVRQAFNAKLFHQDAATYDRGSQTANAIALVLGLVSETHQEAVLDNIVADIRRHRDHTTAGDIGFHFVLEALRSGGRSDVIYDMLSRTDPPSYGYQLKMGATTLTEAWDTNPHSSQNHFMLGHAEDWFYHGLAGLEFDMSKPPSEWITLRPAILDKVDSAAATYDSVLGRIEVRWSRHQGQASVDVAIPPGTSANLYLPSTGAIREGQQPAGRAEGVQEVRREKSLTLFRVASGFYCFHWSE